MQQGTAWTISCFAGPLCSTLSSPAFIISSADSPWHLQCSHQPFTCCARNQPLQEKQLPCCVQLLALSKPSTAGAAAALKALPCRTASRFRVSLYPGHCSYCLQLLPGTASSAELKCCCPDLRHASADLRDLLHVLLEAESCSMLEGFALRCSGHCPCAGAQGRAGSTLLLRTWILAKHLHLALVGLAILVAFEAILIATLLLAHLTVPSQLLQTLGLDSVANLQCRSTEQ